MMHTLAQTAYLDARLGVVQQLPKVGSALEVPLVFDASARELKRMAEQGKVEIVCEHLTQTGCETLIDQLAFRRIR